MVRKLLICFSLGRLEVAALQTEFMLEKDELNSQLDAQWCLVHWGKHPGT